MLKTAANKKAPTLRDIKIKTGVVKRFVECRDGHIDLHLNRTGQELVMYRKESDKQKERIQNLINNGADSHDIAKQNEVLDETTQMLPDCKARLIKAHKELTDMVALMKQSQPANEESEIPEEISAAQAILEKIDMDLLEAQLEQLQIELEKKSNDLQMAAAIGQNLLAQNATLKEENASLLTQVNLNGHSEDLAHIKSKFDILEASYNDLLTEFETIQQQNVNLLDSARSQQETVKKLEEENMTYKLEIQELQKLLKDSTSEKNKAESEASAFVEKYSELEGKLLKNQDKIKHYLDKEQALERDLQEAMKTNDQLTTHNQDLKNTNELQSVKLQEVETMLETYQEYRQQALEQENTIETISLEIEFLREANQKLTSKLSAVGQNSSNGDPCSDMGEKSLLTEIEERRLQLIRDHEKLAQKHAGLTQSHNLSLYRQQKMKHHIARLSQLTSGDAAQEKVRLLEEELAQCQSEKLELEKRVDSLLLRKPLPSQWDEPPIAFDPSAPVDSQRLESLEFRIQQLMEESDSLKKMNQTLRLVKAAESDKLHSTTSNLLERERELDVIKRELANTKFELDELLLSIQEGQISKKKETENDDKALSVKWHESDESNLKENNPNHENVIHSKFPKERQSFEKLKGGPLKTIKVDKSQVDQQCKQQ